jgi:hypothetical protein
MRQDREACKRQRACALPGMHLIYTTMRRGLAFETAALLGAVHLSLRHDHSRGFGFALAPSSRAWRGLTSSPSSSSTTTTIGSAGPARSHHRFDILGHATHKPVHEKVQGDFVPVVKHPHVVQMFPETVAGVVVLPSRLARAQHFVQVFRADNEVVQQRDPGLGRGTHHAVELQFVLVLFNVRFLAGPPSSPGRNWGKCVLAGWAVGVLAPAPHSGLRRLRSLRGSAWRRARGLNLRNSGRGELAQARRGVVGIHCK